MSDPTEHAQMIEDCERRSERLDDWSVNFIDSISRQLADGRALTANQAEKLDEIWERATARG
ncbi:MAG TPA: hypothetical protein VIP05_03045 [Burkholderiaceae bacterium]